MIGFTVCRKSRSNPTIQICLPFSYHPANPLSEFLLEAVFNFKVDTLKSAVRGRGLDNCVIAHHVAIEVMDPISSIFGILT